MEVTETKIELSDQLRKKFLICFLDQTSKY